MGGNSGEPPVSPRCHCLMIASVTVGTTLATLARHHISHALTPRR